MRMETAQAIIERAREHFRKDWLAAGRLGFAALVPLFVGSCTRDCGAQATGRVIEGIGCALLFCALLGAWWSIRAFRNVMRDMRSYRTTLYTDDQGESRAYIRGADEHDLGGALSAFFALVRTVEIRRLGQERIVAAALVWETGKGHHGILSTPPPGRHHTLIAIASSIGWGHVDQDVQGFLTSTGRFVDRHEGLRIAQACGQITERGRARLDGGGNPMLFSDDLW